ncbi:MAG: response regulator [Kiloniellales bacterium]
MRALIADDHWAYRAGMIPLLKKIDRDISIVEANSFQSVLDILSKDRDFDLVLMDLHMPGYEPFAGLRAVRSAAPEVPILVISISESRRDVLRSLELGAAGYVPKTAEPDQVTKAINRVLGGEVSIPRALLELSEDEAQSRHGVNERGRSSEDPFANLTKRQRQVLTRLARGLPNTEIARELGLSVFTVKLHVSSIFKALSVSNRTEAARLVLDRGGLAEIGGQVGAVEK